MKIGHGWRVRLRRTFLRRRFEAEMAEEMRAHVEQEAALHRARGDDPAVARRRAAVEFGHVEAYKEQIRDRRFGRLLDDLHRDVRQALRVLRQSPGFTFVAVVTLGLCLGANIALFSLVRSVLLRPYPYPDADRVVNIGMVWPKWQWGDMVQEICPVTYRDIRDTARSFEAVGFIDATDKADLHLGGQTIRLHLARVTPEVWSVAGVRPALGRCFDERDLAGSGDLAVLSHELWSEAFGGDPTVIGRKIRLDDRTFEVTGVMPAGFSLASNRTRLWIPKILAPAELAENARGRFAFQAIGRLKDGVSLGQVRDELKSIYAAYLAANPGARELTAQTGQTYGAAPLSIWVNERSSGSMLLSVQLAAGLVLLLGCLNIAGLLLVQGQRRIREFALRNALGASRPRLARQLVTETVLLFLFGGALGALIAAALLAWVPAHFRFDEFMRYGQPVRFDGTLAVLSLGLALLGGLVAGALPVAIATRAGLARVLQALDRRTTGSRRWNRVQAVIVVVQVALAFVLLTAAGVTVRNLRSLLDWGFGVETGQRLVASVALPAYRYGSDYAATQGKINPFKDLALERLRALPGVISASAANRVPLSGDSPNKFGFQVRGYRPAPGESPGFSFRYLVHPDFFPTLGLPLLRGRGFTAADREGSPPVVVISEAIARRYFADREAIGGRIAVGNAECEIVGIVGETQNVPLSFGNAPALYLPALQWPVFNDEAVFVVHSALPAGAMAAAVAQVLTGLDPQLAVRTASLDRLQQSAVLTQSAPMEIVGTFALMAVLLTALGLYGVLACVVAQRTRELAIRFALGAPSGAVLRLVLGRGTRLALAGTVLGALAALPLLHWIAPLLASPEAASPATLAGAAGLILVVTAVSSYLPARRAAHVDPVVTLRSD